MSEKHPVLYCGRCGVERRCSISKPHFCLSCGSYIGYFKEKGTKLVIDKESVTERIDQLKSLSANDLFPREFKAGMLYAYLTLLNKEPSLRDASEVSVWMDELFKEK